MRLIKSSLVVFSFLLLNSLSAIGQGRPASVETQVIETRKMTETITVFGQIVAVRESEIATRVSGVINDVPARVGSTVEENDILAQMDKERLGIELDSAEAQLLIAEAGLDVVQAQAERARKSFERAKELNSNGSISAAQFDDRASAVAELQGALSQARARMTAAKNAIDLANYNLNNATVRAPYDGVVLKVDAQPGQFASSGSVIATILDVSNVEVEANIPSRFVQALNLDGIVKGKNDADDTLTMSLRAVLPIEFSDTRTRPVRFTLAENSEAFAIGQPVTLDIPIGASRDALVVPKDALTQARGGWMAFVNDEGKASPRTVTIGAAIGDAFEILSGLAPGDEVVIRGNERLRPGQDISSAGGSRPGAQGKKPAGATDETAKTGTAGKN